MTTHGALIEALPCTYMECDRAMRIREVNRKTCELLGRSRDQLIGRTAFEAAGDARGTGFETFLSGIAAAADGREKAADLPLLNGTFRVNVHPADEGFHLFLTDVTQSTRERDEAQVKASEVEGLQKLLSVILEGLREGVVATDAGGDVIFANAAARVLMGTSVLGSGSSERQAATRPLNEERTGEIPVDQSPLARALEGEDVDGMIEWVRTSPEGPDALIRISASPLRSDGGGITGAVAWFHDITELSQQRHRLEDSERKHRAQSKLLRSLIDGLREGLMVFDRNANVVFANTYSRMFLGPDPEGSDRDQLIADYVQIDLETGNVMEVSDYASSVALRGSAVFERKVIVRGGHLTENLYIVLNAVPSRDEDGEIDGAIVSFRDVTASRKLEREKDELAKRLSQAQKMEAIGQLAGGVAHDFNNLLTVILGNAEALIEETQDTPRLREFGEMTSAAAMRAAELTHRLLAFSRQQPLDPRITNVKALVSGLEALIRRSLGEAVDLHTHSEPSLWTAMIDPGQLENAIINLAINARDAMPDGGHLTIEASNVALDDEYARLHPEVRAGGYVSIAVSDTGTGMPPEVLQRVFEPFFTTKESGRGTGLGLSMVYGFAKQSGGHVQIYSEVGEGTTVTLLIPRANSEGTEAARKTQPDATLPSGSERIAVVEDDRMVRSLIEIILARLGYRVTAFENGPLLLGAMDEGADFDLLLTDVVLPKGMNGRSLATEAQNRRPKMKVLYMSGYTENAIIHHGRLDEGVRLLHKPFPKAELAAKVRAALDDD